MTGRWYLDPSKENPFAAQGAWQGQGGRSPEIMATDNGVVQIPDQLNDRSQNVPADPISDQALLAEGEFPFESSIRSPDGTFQAKDWLAPDMQEALVDSFSQALGLPRELITVDDIVNKDNHTSTMRWTVRFSSVIDYLRGKLRKGQPSLDHVATAVLNKQLVAIDEMRIVHDAPLTTDELQMGDELLGARTMALLSSTYTPLCLVFIFVAISAGMSVALGVVLYRNGLAVTVWNLSLALHGQLRGSNDWHFQQQAQATLPYWEKQKPLLP
jgi:hypothetical protein